MTQLEHAVAQRLFDRHRDGYTLTPAGEELLALVGNIEPGAMAIERWRTRADPVPTVRIAAGPWTAAFLAAHIAQIRGADGLSIEILSGSAPVDLMRREAQIGVRNRRPEGRGLAGRKLVQISFAVYGKSAATDSSEPLPEAASLSVRDWIELSPQDTPPPSAIWLQRKLGSPSPVRLPTTHALLEAAIAGAGLCILPCFIGDEQKGLKRCSASIRELRHDQWLVSHDEDRHTRPVRTVIDRLVELMHDHRDLFAGRRKATVTLGN